MVVVSDLIGHYVDHAHYPPTVQVIASAADFFASWLETILDRQDTVVKTNKQVHNCA